eukprot:gnl/TRDRNA2_/TRDRNA2_131440_c0_seq2.p1 gnl/TRDRNA2_/TRDRNA2_131440_c0~~gnl/TRDRNA2_/TRDRNA2_131440_c0_seq2.p1  ORF type:complete len:444 (+),score=78.46 gnl/TRDRNA2_/TRDRNA2_131440_c0_seq2:138-1469(+)
MRLPMADVVRLAIAFVAVSLPRMVAGMSSRIHMDPFDEFWTFLAYDIGLAPGAIVQIDLVSLRPVNNTYVVLLTHAQMSQWHQSDPTQLPSTSSVSIAGSYSSYMTSFWRQDLYDRVHATFRIDAPSKERYHLGVLNAEQQLMKVEGSFSLVNPDDQQLPLQQEQVPAVLLTMTALIFGSSSVLIFLLLTVWRRGRTALHLVIVSVLLLRGVVLLLHCMDLMHVSRTGLNSVIGDDVWQLLDKVQNIAELMMFLLIALGWRFLRRDLNPTEMRFAVGISVVSFYLGVFEVACTTASTCSGYHLGRYIIHTLCYLVVIVAMNFNLQMVLADIAGAPASMDAGKLYRKHCAYNHFRWIFLAFIVSPVVELFLKVSVMPWDVVWVYVLLKELFCWAIYMGVAIAFRPEPTPLRVFELTVRNDNEDEAGPSSEDEAVGAGSDGDPRE